MNEHDDGDERRKKAHTHTKERKNVDENYVRKESGRRLRDLKP